MLEPDGELATDIARLNVMNDRIAERLASMAAFRIVQLMTEFAPDEPRFIRAIRVPRPGPHGDPPPIIAEDEIVSIMSENPALVGVMVGRFTYDFSDRESEQQKAAHTAVELGLVLAREIWHARFENSVAPSP